MKRKHLSRDIQTLNQRLTVQLAPFQQRSQESRRALSQIHPLWLLAIGLAAGAVTGSLGWRKAYTVGAMGYKLQPLILAGISQWMAGSEG